MIDTEPLQNKPEEISNSNGYPGSDTPPDDKPYRPGGLWESLATVVESVTWQLLYASNEVIGYKLLLTFQKDSYQPQPFSWIPVVATVVVGWLTRSNWNPESPLFNQMDEQVSSQRHDIQIITLMNRPDNHYSQDTQATGAWGNSQSFTTLSHASELLVSSRPTPQKGYDDDNGDPGGCNGGHTYNKHCFEPLCLLQDGVCIFAPGVVDINQHPDTCWRAACLESIEPFIEHQPPANTRCDSTSDGSTVDSRQHVMAFEHTDYMEALEEFNAHYLPVNTLCDSTPDGSTVDSRQHAMTFEHTDYMEALKEFNAHQSPVNTLCDSTPDGSIACSFNKHSQTDRQEPDSHSANIDFVEPETILQDADSTTQTQASPPPAKKNKYSHAVDLRQPKEECTDKSYRCDQPDYNYRADREDNLKRHKNTHLPKEQHTYRHQCLHPDCNYKTVYKTAFELHKNTHLPKEKRPNNCKCDHLGCNYRTARQVDLERHKNTHLPKEKRPNNYKCDHKGCLFKTDWLKCLKLHKEIHLPKEKWANKAHRCDQLGCNYGTDTLRFLTRHKTMHHPPEGECTNKSYRCDHPGCPFQTDWYESLFRHNNKRHQAVEGKEQTDNSTSNQP